MDLNKVKQTNISRKKGRRVARGIGSGRGKTAGRGHKGWGARSGGRKGKPFYEGGNLPLFRKLPKRGFSNAPFKIDYEVVNVSQLETFQAGATITRVELHQAGLITGQRSDLVKILGDGALTKKLTVQADKFSKSAVTKIEAAGGKAVVTGGK